MQEGLSQGVGATEGEAIDVHQDQSAVQSDVEGDRKTLVEAAVNQVRTALQPLIFTETSIPPGPTDVFTDSGQSYDDYCLDEYGPDNEGNDDSDDNHGFDNMQEIIDQVASAAEQWCTTESAPTMLEVENALTEISNNLRLSLHDRPLKKSVDGVYADILTEFSETIVQHVNKCRTGLKLLQIE